ncbi:MAG TPA: nuclear transport factor 2 family protein [Nitrososphaeraceae archaeon]|jgi:hypothetical protein
MKNNEKSEFVVREYFRTIGSGDVQSTLSLFSDNAVVHEPFSKSKYLSGKSEIEPFLNSVVMANQGLDYGLKIEKDNQGDNNVVIADVIFRKEGSIRCLITFQLENTRADKSVRTIKLMDIEFVD